MRDTRNGNTRPRTISSTRLSQSPADQLGTAFRRLNAAFTGALKPHGLTPLDANIVMILWVDGSMRVGMLQKRLAINSSTFTGALDRLEKAGFIERKPAPGDRRATILEPLRLADSRQADIEAVLLDTEDLFFSGLTTSEQKELARLLHKVTSV